MGAQTENRYLFSSGGRGKLGCFRHLVLSKSLRKPSAENRNRRFLGGRWNSNFVQSGKKDVPIREFSNRDSGTKLWHPLPNRLVKNIKTGTDASLKIKDEYAERAIRELYYPTKNDKRIIAGESRAAGLAGFLAVKQKIASRPQNKNWKFQRHRASCSTIPKERPIPIILTKL